MENIVQGLRKSGVIAILRGIDSSRILPIVRSLYEGGIKAVEVTLTHPDALDSITRIVKETIDDDMLVGAGTVLDPESARAAIFAGAQFIISPTLNLETIKTTKRYGAISIPGAYTPTEILTAYENGADLIKVFPATALGPSFLKDLSGPLPQIPLIPTGGITLENMGDYLRAGAAGVGIGSALAGSSQRIDKFSLEELTNKARTFINEFEKVKISSSPNLV